MPLKGYGLVPDLLHIFTQAMQDALDRERREKEREKEKEAEEERQRQRLRQAAAAQEQSKKKDKRKKKYSVVVIGCGASGIAALSKLAEAGVDAVGLEASSRMGGRINTVEFGNNVVDLGAAWCHGEVNNRVYELAGPFNLLGRPPPKDDDSDQDWFLLSNGTLIPTGNARALLTSVTDAVERAEKNNAQGIYDFVRSGVRDGRIVSNPAAIPFTEPFLEWYGRDNHVGGQTNPNNGKSLKGLVKHQTCPGEFWLNWKGQGYKTILDVLLRRNTSSPLNVKIDYNQRVVNINWEPPKTDEEDPEPLVWVWFNNGTFMKASRVIVTVSLGVLKNSYQTMFTPPLPADKISAIQNLQFCVLDKIYIEFEKAWWPKDLTNFRLFWRDEDKQNISETEEWVTHIHGLRIVEHQPNLLLAWIYGEGAKAMEKVSTDQLRKGVDKLMDIFRLNFEVAPIRSIKRSTWASDPLIRGAYSYRAVSTELCPTASAEVLSQPLMKMGVPVVCFAGEATSHKWHNAVHGAIDAGFREANRVRTSIVD